MKHPFETKFKEVTFVSKCVIHTTYTPVVFTALVNYFLWNHISTDLCSHIFDPTASIGWRKLATLLVTVLQVTCSIAICVTYYLLLKEMSAAKQKIQQQSLKRSSKSLPIQISVTTLQYSLLAAHEHHHSCFFISPKVSSEIGIVGLCADWSSQLCCHNYITTTLHHIYTTTLRSFFRESKKAKPKDRFAWEIILLEFCCWG